MVAKRGVIMEFSFNEKKRTVKPLFSNKDIFYYFEKMGFFFSKEVITRYYLSLKTKPFIILTGISGTGKTKIAQIFADYICQNDVPEERSKRIVFIPVRPDWMDNRGLLGYYNLLDEKYHTTSLLELLLEAKKNPDKPYFVILDEMNLAKVEQYFSDFLSIMESRTSSSPDGEPIPLCFSESTESRNGLSIPPKLNIPPNVYFTGTVNVDESTYMFSPKVLDRANVIEFNEVNLGRYNSMLVQNERFILQDSDVTEGLSVVRDSSFCSKEDFTRASELTDGPLFLNILGDILNTLAPHTLHFGYRVINEISRFIVYTNEAVRNFNLEDALDIQILQKILPKFHGTQAKLEEPLKKLLEFCYRDHTVFNESLLSRDLDRLMEDKRVRFPRSACKLSRMINNLKIQGYTSYIE